MKQLADEDFFLSAVKTRVFWKRVFKTQIEKMLELFCEHQL
jgi:hypothetical protein